MNVFDPETLRRLTVKRTAGISNKFFMLAVLALATGVMGTMIARADSLAIHFETSEGYSPGSIDHQPNYLNPNGHVGTATINGSGSYDFRIEVTDPDSTNGSDTYWIVLSNGYNSGSHPLGGGHAEIHPT